MAIVTLTNDNFEREVLSCPGPVLVDFWASWCGPCRMMAPILDELAAEHPELKVGKVNVDEEGQLAAKFGIMSIPTLLVFKKGTLAGKTVGVTPKEELIKMI